MVRKLVALVFVLLSGCGGPSGAPEKFLTTDVTGADFARDFSLTDHNGKSRSLADFKGRVVVVFFGFTHCPDICPTTLGELALALKKMGADAKDIQVLFVTIDPERDTQQALAQYVTTFDPGFLGLRGSPEETQAIAKEFKVVSQKQGAGASYSMDHSAGAYLFDPRGRLRLYATPGQKADALAHDIKLLLAKQT
jgi:protein SCO1/2